MRVIHESAIFVVLIDACLLFVADRDFLIQLVTSYRVPIQIAAQARLIILSSSNFIGVLGVNRKLFLVLPLLFSTAAFADSDDRFAVTHTLGTSGVGIGGGYKTDWSLFGTDQFQWRTHLAGFSVDDVEDVSISNVEYDADIDYFQAGIGLDWFPFAGFFSDQLFTSVGLQYIDFVFDGRNSETQVILGDTYYVEAYTESFETRIERQGVVPYLSVGWGNRIGTNKSWMFGVELGVNYSSNEAYVTVENSQERIDEPLSEEELADERKQVQDEFGRVAGFLNFSVSYRF